LAISLRAELKPVYLAGLTYETNVYDLIEDKIFFYLHVTFCDIKRSNTGMGKTTSKDTPKEAL